MRAKEFHFPLSVEWIGGRRVRAAVEGKHSLDVATPPEFRGTNPDVWSPEDLFVSAAASCLAVTLAGLAEREGLRLDGLVVTGDGVASTRPDGCFGFTSLRLHVDVETADPDEVERARELAEKAEETCLVTVSLDVPVETVIDVRAPLVA